MHCPKARTDWEAKNENKIKFNKKKTRARLFSFLRLVTKHMCMQASVYVFGIFVWVWWKVQCVAKCNVCARHIHPDRQKRQMYCTVEMLSFSHRYIRTETTHKCKRTHRTKARKRKGRHQEMTTTMIITTMMLIWMTIKLTQIHTKIRINMCMARKPWSERRKRWFAHQITFISFILSAAEVILYIKIVLYKVDPLLHRFYFSFPSFFSFCRDRLISTFEYALYNGSKT